MAKRHRFGQINGSDGQNINGRLNWERLKLRRLKWQNTNLEDWNEKWWNLKVEFCILTYKKTINIFNKQIKYFIN